MAGNTRKKTTAKKASSGAKKGSSAKKRSSSRSSASGSRKSTSKPANTRQSSPKSVHSAAKAARSGGSSSQRSRSYSQEPMMNTEVLCWCLFAAAVLIFICVIGFGGRLGNAFGDLLFGVMGTNAYVFPFMIFFLTIFLMANHWSRTARLRSLSAVALFCVLCGIWQLMNYGDMTGTSVSDFFEVGQQYHAGGGAIGGALILFFRPTVGLAGTWAVLLIAVFLFVALVTQKTLFISTGRKGSEAIEERHLRNEEMRRERNERRQAEREAREAQAEARRLVAEARKAQKEQELANEESSDTISPVFLSVLKKDGSADAAQDPGRQPGFTTDLFGDTRAARGRRGKMPAITPDKVVFGTAEKTEGSGSIVTSFDAGAGQSSGSASSAQDAGRSKDPGSAAKAQTGTGAKSAGGSRGRNNTVPFVRLTGSPSGSGSFADPLTGSSASSIDPGSGSFADPLAGSSASSRDPGSGSFADPLTGSAASSRDGSSTVPAEDPGRLSDSFVIHRAQTAEDPAEYENEDIYDDSNARDDASAPVVTARDIRNAGVSGSRKKAGEEAKSGAHKKTDEEAKAGLTKAETQQEVDSVAKEIEEKEEEEIPYVFPSTSLLEKVPRDRGGMTDDELRETAAKLQQILATFGVSAQVTNVSCGPSVTRYELMPQLGTKVSKITNLADDIKLNLAAADIRIEAPIPGKAAVGIEVPNEKTSMVYLRELIDSEEFRKTKSRLAYVVGKDIAGRIIVSDIAKMPHLLIAGATGSGKSVFINTLIMSIIYNASPSEVKMIMIDPKVVELSVYNGIPHLFIPVVTDPKKAAGALNWGVAEMTRRYQLFAEVGVRNLAGYNAKVDTLVRDGVPDAPKKMPQIVIIVDELADLMMVSGNEVEDAICRLAQLARACGIHLVIATQRPSVDVITGLIKANIPSRIAFAVSSGTDSRTILDMNGAEKLLGNGDMLFSPQTYKKPVRVQGAFVSDEEIQRVVDEIRRDDDSPAGQELMKKRMQEIQAASVQAGSAGGGGDTDELFAEAGRFIIQKDKASIGMLQRWFKIGFNRAARIMDQLSEAEVVGPDEGTKPRKVLMTAEQFENYLENN